MLSGCDKGIGAIIPLPQDFSEFLQSLNFNSIPGVDFDICYTRRIETIMAGGSVPIIELTDLKQNKLASGRP